MLADLERALTPVSDRSSARRESDATVAFLSASSQLGGAERSLLDVMASLRSAVPGWSLHLIAPEDGPLVTEAVNIGVTATVLRFPPALSRLGDSLVGSRVRLAGRLAAAVTTLPDYLIQLRRVLDAIAPHVVHTNGFKPHLLGTLATRRAVPLVWHMHDYISTRPVMQHVLRVLGSRRVTALANSASVAADVRRVCRSLPVHTMYNAVRLDYFTPEGSALSLDTGGPTAAIALRVGLVATYAKWKGHEVFLRALSLLPRALTVRAYIIGGELYRTEGSQYRTEELRKLTRDFGLEDRVAFTGHVSDAAAAYRGLDVVVHASTRPEPFGLVIAEAMACGRAVIVSAAGGAAELIAPGIDALVFPPGDAPALAECIGLLAADPELRLRLGREARRSAERRFDHRHLATDLLPLYRSLLAA